MPVGQYKRKSLEERFWNNVNKTEYCWNWIGSIKNNGYGQISDNHKKFYPHRVSFELHKGKIPNKLSVLHMCDNRKCVNPDHLFLGTQSDNMKDMIKKGRKAVGEKNGVAKLNSLQIKEIRKKYNNGVRNKELCIEYNVSHSTIHKIVFNELWKHINVQDV